MTEAHFLLDTNILIYLITGATAPLRARIEMLEPGKAVTSTICAAEVAVGLDQAASEVHQMVERVYGLVEPLPFDLVAAARFGTLPHRRGRSDRLIAAHSLSLGLILVTNNERDFADIPGLTVENWTR